MKKSLMFVEIFGSDEIRPPAREPKVEVHHRPWDLLPASGNGHRNEMEDDLMSKIFGCDDATSNRIVKPVPPPAVLAADGINELLNDLQKRVDYVRRTGTMRKATIRHFVDLARNSAVCKSIKNDDGWNKLAESIENFVASAIVAS
jgi:hypothetical protein